MRKLSRLEKAMLLVVWVGVTTVVASNLLSSRSVRDTTRYSGLGAEVLAVSGLIASNYRRNKKCPLYEPISPR